MSEVLELYERLRSLFGPEIDVVELEELAGEIARRLPKPVTRVVKTANSTVEGVLEVASSSARGRLRELVVRGETPSYRVRVYTDGIAKVDMSWEELSRVSQHLVALSAYVDEEGLHVFRVEDVSWAREMRVTVEADGRVVLRNVVCIYDEYI